MTHSSDGCCIGQWNRLHKLHPPTVRSWQLCHLFTPFVKYVPKQITKRCKAWHGFGTHGAPFLCQKQHVYVYFSLYMNNSATTKHRFIVFQTQALIIKTKPKHLFENEMIITIFYFRPICKLKQSKKRVQLIIVWSKATLKHCVTQFGLIYSFNHMWPNVTCTSSVFRTY